MSTAKPGADYQVFLSFRGPDTRQGFMDCLYHFMVDAGICVFRDNEEIRPGDKIEEILRAINSSIVCIPIFSKNYAFSKWCLRELAAMVEQKKIIMPVFYDVTPDDVELKTCLYRDGLIKHKKEKEKEQWERALKEVLEISGWKSSKDQEEKALKEVVKIKGWELKHVGHGELSKSIVKAVLDNLKVKHKVVTDHLIGMHERVETVLRYLNGQVPEVRYVGIYGLGGSGKTTLAKVEFNHLFDCFDACSFLANVRESSINGLKHLQEKLICDLQGKHSRGVSDMDDGMKTIKDICLNKKVLIVLDDVNSREQIESLAGSSNWFSSGSKIIITTRDKGFLVADKEGLERDQNNKLWTLEMEEMNLQYALQLFSRHAFMKDSPPPEYLQLSKELVTASGQLPLTLEIIGSHLYGKTIGEWEDKRNSLAKTPPKDIQKMLMMSYEGLDFRTKQIFLDIACFTSELEKENAIYMWRSCDFRPETGLKELVSKSLVKFQEYKLWMHDHIRDLGREIICLENFMDVGARCRLWNQMEAFGTLTRKEGTRKIELLHLPGNIDLENFTLTCEHFRDLRNLRYLSLGSTSLIGDFEHLFSKLRWLSWERKSPDLTMTDLNLEQLVVLHVSGSCISEKWEGWSQIKLAVLDLSNSGISKMPNLSQFGSLERLILEHCQKLSETDRSIGKLKRLKRLNLKRCISLRGLPTQIAYLESLEEIFLNGSHEGFRSLPESIGKLKSLSILEIVNVDIVCLPRGTGGLQKLKRLSLKMCRYLEGLPEEIGDAKSLLELDLPGTGICGLPNSLLGNPNKDAPVERLDLSRCSKLKKIDSSIGKLKSLKHLNVRDCTFLGSLPEEIGSLETLEELFLSGCHEVSKLPHTIWKLRRLKCLFLNSCRIQRLPEEIGDMESLIELDPSWTLITELPDSFGGLKKLECLYLRGCHSIEKLPHSFGNLTSLLELALSNSFITELPESFGGLKKLKHLDMRHCRHIKKLPDTFGELKSLSELDISYSAIDELPDSLGHLEKLREIRMEPHVTKLHRREAAAA